MNGNGRMQKMASRAKGSKEDNKCGVAKVLNDLEIDFRAVEHPAVFTVAESKQVMPEKVPVKSLLLKERQGNKFVLVIIPGDKRLDTKKASEIIRAGRLMFASPEELKQKLGVTPGSVSLFSLLNDSAKSVRVIVDKKLLSEDEIGFHPNDNTKTLFIKGADIKKFLSYTGNQVFIREL